MKPRLLHFSITFPLVFVILISVIESNFLNISSKYDSNYCVHVIHVHSSLTITIKHLDIKWIFIQLCILVHVHHLHHFHMYMFHIDVVTIVLNLLCLLLYEYPLDTTVHKQILFVSIEGIVIVSITKTRLSLFPILFSIPPNRYF